jgi:hypothetical protein
MNGILKKIPGTLKGEIIERQEPCKICKEKSGMQIGEVGYWNISINKIVKCQKCGLVQLDTMLSEEETYKGCLAYSMKMF